MSSSVLPVQFRTQLAIARAMTRQALSLRIAGYILMTLALFAVPARAQNNIDARLVAESRTPAAGSTVMLAIDMRPKAGWHGYWKNPGDAGFGAVLDWILPKGAKAGVPRFPVPERLVIAGLMNHVFNGDHALLVPLVVPAGLAPGTPLPIRLRGEWLACTDKVCVPERADLSLDLIVGDGAAGVAERARFDGWRAKLPRPLGSPASFARSGDTIRLAIPYPASRAADDPWFFAATEDALAYAKPQKVARNGDLLIVEATASGSATPQRIEGVLAFGTEMGLEVVAAPGRVPVAADTGWRTLLLALGGAVLGGLLLNILPCVFPIISLKALSVARAGGDEAAARRDALAYTAGVVVTCLALGALLLGLRAAGQTVGWAFQLQNPWVLAVLLALAVAITLNLLGVFELRGFGGGEALAGRGGAAGSFWTGALAAFVATPCTGPFMAAALGAALVLPVGAALAIFAGLGLGLATPFLLIGFVPAIRTRLPRPGPWMARFRRWMALPMALTAAALAWLLWPHVTGEAREGGQAAAIAGAIPFDEARLARLRAEGRPVFLYFTADWCITCKVNEKAAIERAETLAAFKRANVVVMAGDWTNGDPAVTRFLESRGRSGVPLYLWYPAGGEPEELPQVLTPATLTALAE
jgi:DsbC/DsbD-like thiol-disulfide interchange protein/cytochrome c biogenesis protein CcdA